MSLKSVNIRTCVHRIARWIVRRAVTLRLILVNPTGRVDAATCILAKIAVAETGLMRIAVASRITRALETVYGLSALGVNAAWSSQALVSA